MNVTRNISLFASCLGLVLSFADPALATPLTGSASTGNAVTATATDAANGVSATAVSGYGTRSTSTSSIAVFGTSSGSDDGNTAGMVGTCSNCPGIIGYSLATDGVRGYGAITGVLGSASTTTGDGVHGTASGSGNGVVADNSSTGSGLYAFSAQGNAIYAMSNTVDAIVGIAGTNNGAAGIWGKAHGTGTFGVYSSGDLYVRGWSGTPGDAYKPGGGSFKATSDARVKKDVAEFTPALAELEQVRPVRFKYNGLGGTEDTGKEYVGVIAQDLEKVLPFMVSSHERKLHASDARPTEIKEVDPSAFTYLLINAVKELGEQNKQLAREVSALSEQSKQLREIATLICSDHPGSKACNQALALASLPRASK